MSTVSSIPGFLTVSEAAELIGVDGSQIRRYCIAYEEKGPGEGRLRGRKVGQQWMIHREDAKKFKRQPAGNPNLVKG